MSVAHTGLPALPAGVTEQHQHLAAEIKQVREILAAGETWASVGPLLDQLLADIGAHFAHEQELMRHGGYPGLPGHQREHEEFLAKIRAMRSRCDEEHSELMGVLADMLHTWFVRHESSSDRRAAEFLKLDEW
jgi:hemerythrin